MTSWQEPPRTRREARERERLRQQQDGHDADPVENAGTTDHSSATSAGPRRAGTSDATPAGAMPNLNATSAPTGSGVPSEHTLTRRQLRAMLAAQGAAGQASDTASDEETSAQRDPSSSADRDAPGTPVAERPLTPHQPLESTKADDAAAAVAPAGHWSHGLNAPPGEEDEPLLAHGALSSNAPTTSSALILPSLPVPPNGASSTASGEIMITGSIDLPAHLGRTGATGEIDSRDIDRFLDSDDDARVSGVAPVAASRSVSSQAATRDLISPPKKERVNVPFILALTAGVLALGVVTLLVVGAILNLF